MLGRCPDWLETELLGLASALDLDLKAVILWETPEARVNCSRSSTLVRPLAKLGGEKGISTFVVVNFETKIKNAHKEKRRTKKIYST